MFREVVNARAKKFNKEVCDSKTERDVIREIRYVNKYLGACIYSLAIKKSLNI